MIPGTIFNGLGTTGKVSQRIDGKVSVVKELKAAKVGRRSNLFFDWVWHKANIWSFFWGVKSET